MPSDILKDGHSTLTEDAKKRQEDLDQEARNIRASMGLEFLEDSDSASDIDVSTDASGSSDDLDDLDGTPAFLLMPHERKLPIAMQRQLILGRRRASDGIEEDDGERLIVNPQKSAAQREHTDHSHQAHALSPTDMLARTVNSDIDSDATINGASGGSQLTARADINTDGDSSNHSSTGGGMRLEQAAELRTDALAAPIKPVGIESSTSESGASSTGGGTRNERTTAPVNEPAAAIVRATPNDNSSDASSSTGGGTRIEKNAAPLTEANTTATKTAINENRSSDTSTSGNTGTVGGSRIEKGSVPANEITSTVNKMGSIDSKNADASGNASTGGGTRVEKGATAPNETGTPSTKADRSTLGDGVAGISKVEKILQSATVTNVGTAEPKTDKPAAAANASPTEPKTDKPAASPVTNANPSEPRADRPATAIPAAAAPGTNTPATAPTTTSATAVANTVPVTATPAPTAATPVPTTAPPAPTVATPASTAATPAPAAATPSLTAAAPTPGVAPASVAATPAPTVATPVSTAAVPTPTAATPVPAATTPVPTAAAFTPTAATPALTTAAPAPAAATSVPTAATPVPTAATSTPPAATSASTPTPSSPGLTPTPLLNDARNQNNSLFNTTLQGVSALDPSKVSLSSNERVNVAGALTANITNTPGFDRINTSPSNVSIAASQSGDRVFAINNQNPGAPNAVYTSVDVNQARAQPIEVSSSQALPPAPTPPPPVQQTAVAPQIEGSPASKGIN